MNNIFAKVAIVLTLCTPLSFVAYSTLADEECRDPIADWQPREALKKLLEEQGWVVQRIRIDDGCYQVRALDDQGRRVEATYAPASLKLLELKTKNENHERREQRDSRRQSR